MVFEYSKMGQMIALNVETINSFCLPHLVEVGAFRMLSVCFALVMVTFTGCTKSPVKNFLQSIYALEIDL